MTIEELKRALIEVHAICADRYNCEGCPFGIDYHKMHICNLSPTLNNKILPEDWLVDAWRVDFE